jgi:hypothetical protein
MDFCRRELSFVLALSLGMSMPQGAFLAAAADPQEEKAEGRPTLRLDHPIFGIQDTINICGPVDLKWLEP